MQRDDDERGRPETAARELCHEGLLDERSEAGRADDLEPEERHVQEASPDELAEEERLAELQAEPPE